MEKWIILKMLDPNILVSKNPITDVEDIAVIDIDGALMIFDSLEDASEYQEDWGISGQCIELPLY
tara:strand:+ start:6217 stop:6411 length:195 start_codon:yes stop_codon:yes gene_type:complete